MRPISADTRLTAVVVCYRDAPAVPILYERLTGVFAKLGVDYEIYGSLTGIGDWKRETTRI